VEGRGGAAPACGAGTTQHEPALVKACRRGRGTGSKAGGGTARTRDGTRRDIVRRTLGTELSVSTIAGEYPMSFAAVQKHVAVLERAGLVVKRRHGREQLVRANPGVKLYTATKMPPKNFKWPSRREFTLDDCFPPDHIEQYVHSSLKNGGLESFDMAGSRQE